MIRYPIFFILSVFFTLSSVGQYLFDSKKEEKLYLKMEEYYALDDYESILDNESNYLTKFEHKKDTLSALVYSFLGDAYLYWEGDLNKSLDFYQKEYEVRKSIGNVPGNDLNNVIFNLGIINDELGHYQKTEALYLELLKIDKEKFGENSEEYYQTAYALIDHYIYTEDPEKGMEQVKSLKKYIRKNTFKDAMVLKATGDLYEILGSFNKAEKALLEALQILVDEGLYPSLETVGVLNSLGGLYLSMGKVPESEELYLEALNILERLAGDNSEYEVAVKGNLARIYTALGNYEMAETILKSNLEIDQEYYGENSFIYGLDAYNLALNYLYAGDYETSEKYHLIAVEIFREVVGEEGLDFARVLNNLTLLYTKTRALEKAKLYGEKSIKAFELSVGADHQQTSFANYNLADAYFTDGDLEAAEKYHLQSLNIRKKTLGENHPVYAKSTNKLAILKWKQNRLDEALKYYRETFGNYFNQINLIFPILSEAEKTRFYYNNLKPTFEQFNSFIVKSSVENKALIGEMYDYQLATKGLILYATGKVREAILTSGDSMLIDKYNTWVEQKEQLARLFSASDLPLEERNAKIDSLNKTSDNLEKEISRSSADFAKTFTSKKPTWKDVQKTLQPDEAAIEIIRFRDFVPDSAGVFTEEVYYAALVLRHDTRGYPEMVIMRNGKLMETRYLANYRNAIKYKVDENFSYRMYWRPLANKLDGIRKVYLSPDGVFNQISIYTLQNPESGNYTLDEIEIKMVTNTKDLVALNTQEPGKAGPSYLIGFPNYNLGNVEDEAPDANEKTEKAADRSSRGSRGEGIQTGTLSRSGSISRGLRGNLLRYMRSNQLLALLPGTEKEVNLIDSLHQSRAESTKTYLGNEALEENIKGIRNPKVLHIATHGFFLENTENDPDDTDAYVENPLLRSGLILAGANSYIATGEISDNNFYLEDGILTAYEAMNLRLDHTELVVLSACETGLGEIMNGEGVYGMQRAFQVAGAKAMIMSMWTVDDEATQELMTLFYQEWLNGKTKHESFIYAQKRLRDKWQDPYYWGAFVMIGG